MEENENNQDSQNSHQENKAQKISKKDAKRQAGKRRKTAKNIKTFIIVILVIGLLGYGVYLLGTSGPQGEDLSREVPIMDDTSHYQVGFSEDFEYNSNPPTSGPHYGQTARSGFREEAIPDGHLIHNLEHGDIWISFHPEIPEEAREELRQFAGAKVIITPREKNDTDIALAAWGRLDTFDLENGTVPVQRIEDFIRRHMHKGPERVPGASGGI